ncbi:hypothetical protein NQ318_008246 [Aromia moschata]|uniref:Uncharacterized protein n=1 Tax=Aromia moschata TaxID=1265417 RepID=A0AAV8Y7I0_9CUCU|nr:hypothetical protein NQ318_008246 [Aromia moschata]
MTHYLRDQTWKETIDKLQYDNECCGISSYENWHEIEWLNKYHVDVDSDTVKQFRTSQETLKLPVTPWSCCKVDFPMQCLHDPLQQAQYAHIWVDEPTVVTDSIHSKGCLEGLKKPIVAVIDLFIFFTSVIFILHIIIFFISRILYTSCRNAVVLSDTEGIAPGWIFGRGDCGYSRGKTLGEIMKRKRRKRKSATLEKCFQKRFGRKKKDTTEDDKLEGTQNMNTSFLENLERKDKAEDDTGTVDVVDDQITFNPELHSTARPKNFDANEDETAGVGTSKADEEPGSMEGELKRLMQA